MSVAFDDALTKQGIARTGVAGTPKLLSATEANTLGQDSFLKLMTEQLKNQDPFAPTDNTQMVAQMAQFSSVSGISEMNKTLKDMSARMQASDTAQAISYVGKAVLVEGTSTYAAEDGTVHAVLPLDTSADDVQVNVSDNSGNLLRTLQYGARGAGNIDLAWDGKTESGGTAPEGPYKFTASVLRNGTRVASPVNVWAPVTSVSLGTDGSAPMLNLGLLGQKPISAVRQVG